MYGFLERTQILSTETSQATDAYIYEGLDMRKQFYRHESKGGWPFSTSAHGWPITYTSKPVTPSRPSPPPSTLNL